MELMTAPSHTSAFESRFTEDSGDNDPFFIFTQLRWVTLKLMCIYK